jgi:membrane-associated phospholipid phosphatase
VPDRRLLLWLLAAVLFAVTPVVWLWEREVGPLPGERWLEAHVPELASTQTLQAGNFFTGFAVPIVAGITVVLVTLIVRHGMGWRVALLVPAAAAVAVPARVLKELLPTTPLSGALHGYHSQGGLPSGHTAYAAALFGLLAVLAFHRRRGELVLLCVTILAGMGISLLIGRAHLPSDVLAGYALGFGWTLALLLLTSTRRRAFYGSGDGRRPQPAAGPHRQAVGL